jgi:hypothetical protein
MTPEREHTRSDLVTITRRMNHHGSMTVEVVERNATRHVVEYSSEELKSTLAALPTGATIPLGMQPLGSRANVWRAVSFGQPKPTSVETRPGLAAGDRA